MFFLENALEYSLYGREFNVFIMFIGFPEVWDMLLYKRHLEKREGFIMPTYSAQIYENVISDLEALLG